MNLKQEIKNPFVRFVYRINQFVGRIENVLGVVVLVSLVTFCMVSVICRYVLKISTPWSDEMSRFILIGMAWIGSGFACYTRDHLQIEAISGVIEKKAKHPELVLHIMSYVREGLVLAFTAVFLRIFVQYVLRVKAQGTETLSMGIPAWIPMIPVIVGCSLIIFHTLCKLLLPMHLWGVPKIDESNTGEGSNITETAEEP